MIDLYKEAKNIHVVIRAYGQNKMQHASGGVSRVRAIVELLRLGVCDRLDLYGFSSGGGKYFIQRMKVSSAHPIRAGPPTPLGRRTSCTGCGWPPGCTASSACTETNRRVDEEFFYVLLHTADTPRVVFMC